MLISRPPRGVWPGLVASFAILAILACSSSTTSDEPVAVAIIDVNPPSVSLTVGQTATIAATPKSASGQVLSARTVTWTSSASNVAAVDGNGAVTGMSAGNATITATSGAASKQVAVTVTPRARITVAPTTLAFSGTSGGVAAQQSVNITNSGGSTLSGLAVSVQYGTGATGWLTTNLSSTTAPASLSVQPNLASLAAGSYTATISVTSSVAENSPTTIPVTLTVTAGSFAFTISGGGNGTGTVTSSPAGINCTITNGTAGTTGCSASFTAGSSVTLTATPAAGNAFSNWIGSCSGVTGTVCTLVMSSARATTAVFTRAAAPVVTTGAASFVTARSARFNGTITEDGVAYTVWFEYGTSSTLATFTASGPGQGPCGVAICEWFFDATGASALAPNTTYFYRIVAQNATGITRGQIRSLTTLAGTGSAPVISSLTSTLVMLSDPTCTSNASSHRLTFSFTDANSDVSTTGTPVFLNYLHQPGGSTGLLEWSVSSSTGTGSSGTISLFVCQVFGSSTSVAFTVTLRDQAGNVSNALTVTVAKPAGAASVIPGVGRIDDMRPLPAGATNGTTTARRVPPR